MKWFAYLLFGLAISPCIAQQPRPNIIWITCEDISPFIHSYGFEGIKTPNIDQLALEGVQYMSAYTTAGVCAPSRSSIITGMYPTSIGTQHMRTTGDPKYQPVPPYSAVIPEYVKAFPEYLRGAGYYCTNNSKQDYQFEAPVTAWDESGPAASHRNRPAGVPFFAVYNFFMTHESQTMRRTDPLRVDTTKIQVPPIYPDTKTVRHDMARLFTNIELMDAQVGELIAMLKQDGVYDNSYIFFYSDHGGALPWMKREILERGTHIPLIIRFPNGAGKGTKDDQLVSAIDFAPTVLSIAGIAVPKHLQGQAFLGSQKSSRPRSYVFAGRDRMDTEYDRARMVRDTRYRYVYNYMPEKPYYQEIEFRRDVPMMRELLQLHEQHKLGPVTESWFGTKPAEELYDVETDPWELKNLAGDPAYATKLKELRTVFQKWTKDVGDMSEVPEKEMIRKMWNGAETAPSTAKPVIMEKAGKLAIICDTKGASIGYRIKSRTPAPQPAHTILTWDAGQFGGINGKQAPGVQPWLIYDGKEISLQRGDTLEVNAQRIGYKPSTVVYVR